MNRAEFNAFFDRALADARAYAKSASNEPRRLQAIQRELALYVTMWEPLAGKKAEVLGVVMLADKEDQLRDDLWELSQS